MHCILFLSHSIIHSLEGETFLRILQLPLKIGSILLPVDGYQLWRLHKSVYLGRFSTWNQSSDVPDLEKRKKYIEFDYGYNVQIVHENK